MNPFDEYESQKNMAVRRVTDVALIDRMIVYGRELEARVKTLNTLIIDAYGKLCPGWVYEDAEQAMARIAEKGNPDVTDN